MLWWFLLYDNMNQQHIHLYPLACGPPLGHHRALNCAPSAIQQLTPSYLFCTW